MFLGIQDTEDTSFFQLCLDWNLDIEIRDWVYGKEQASQ